MSITVKFAKVNSDAVEPKFAHNGDSGFDLHATSEHMLYRGMGATVSTGLKFELPAGYEIQIRPKSGLSAMSPLRVILGTIDSSYRGEVRIIVENVNGMPWKIDKGDKIAQGVIVKLPEIMFEETSEGAMGATTRGDAGFGSTGIKGEAEIS